MNFPNKWLFSDDFLLLLLLSPMANFIIFSLSQAIMADEDLSLNEDQLLDNLDDANNLLNEVKIIYDVPLAFAS